MKPLTDEEIAELRKAFGEPLEPESWHDGKVLRLLDEVERSRALLKRIEWSGVSWDESACPECGGEEPTRGRVPDDDIGHRPGCELAALIAGTEAAPDLRAVLQRLVDAVTESGRKGVIYLGSALGEAREALRLSGVRPG